MGRVEEWNDCFEWDGGGAGWTSHASSVFLLRHRNEAALPKKPSSFRHSGDLLAFQLGHRTYQANKSFFHTGQDGWGWAKYGSQRVGFFTGQRGALCWYFGRGLHKEVMRIANIASWHGWFTTLVQLPNVIPRPALRIWLPPCDRWCFPLGSWRVLALIPLLCPGSSQHIEPQAGWTPPTSSLDIIFPPYLNL